MLSICKSQSSGSDFLQTIPLIAHHSKVIYPTSHDDKMESKLGIDALYWFLIPTDSESRKSNQCQILTLAVTSTLFAGGIYVMVWEMAKYGQTGLRNAQADLGT